MKTLNKITLLLKKKGDIYISLIIAVMCISFLIGAFSSLYRVGAGSWVSAVIYKTKSLIGLTKVKGIPGSLFISTSRYEFETVKKASGVGVYQLATTDGNNILAVERNTGLLIVMTPENNSYKEKILSQSIFPKNIEGKININKKAIMANSKPPIIMDLHFAINKLFYSIVVDDSKDGKVCQSLILFEVPLISLEEAGEPIEIFRSPCSFDLDNAVMWAGRITNNENRIFLSIGEQRFDRSGYPKKDIFTEDELVTRKTVFGKILSFNPYNFEYYAYSSGHRNAQGLFWDAERYQLLSSEHGPNGGDEVNLIIPGNNYGWPTVTFGKPYRERYPSGVVEINEGKNPGTGVDLQPERKGFLTGTHDGYTPPIISWIPGVGVGNLLRVPSNSPLKDWRGDILVTTMGEGNLHRLRLFGKSVVLDENIHLGKRIRDLILLSNGNIAITLDEGSLFILKVSDL